MTNISAYKRFVANEPESAIEYRTIELYHPDFSETYRFVKSFTNQTFTLESDAPRNPSEDIEFLAAGMRITEPAERDDGEQFLNVAIGNVDGRIKNILDQISGASFLTPVEVVYRKYLSTNPDAPANNPLYMSASTFNFSGRTSAEFTAEDANLAVKRSGKIYTTQDFPGLA